MTIEVPSKGTVPIYETDRSLGEYLLFHYGRNDIQFPWAEGPLDALEFPRRSVEELVDSESSVYSALDLGCSVGRSSFILTELSKDVLGIDFSKSFIDAANLLLQEGKMFFQYHEEGSCWKEGLIEIDKRPTNLTFEVGDACNLRNDLQSFDLVHAANLLCRLQDPMKLIKRLPNLVAPGGQLLLTTPFTWLEEFTPREKWINGKDSATALCDLLSDSFDLEFEKDLPFLIREHRRKFQYTIALGTRWRRK